MNTATIDITGQVTLTYDENSKEFKEALEGYQKCIERGGSKESMLKHVAFYITRFGTDGMVEGVGYVGVNGNVPSEDLYSGIMVNSGYDEFEFEMQ